MATANKTLEKYHDFARMKAGMMSGGKSYYHTELQCYLIDYLPISHSTHMVVVQNDNAPDRSALIKKATAISKIVCAVLVYTPEKPLVIHTRINSRSGAWVTSLIER